MAADRRYLNETPPGTQVEEVILDEIEVATSSSDSEEDQGPLPTPPLPSASQPTVPKLRWKPAAWRRFLQLVLDAKNKGLLGTSNKTCVLNRVLASIVPILQREFPRDPFTVKNLLTKYRNTNTLYRKVKALRDLSGVGYDDHTGVISTSEERWLWWQRLNPGYKWVEDHGFPGMESLMAYLWPSETATGQNIAEPGPRGRLVRQSRFFEEEVGSPARQSAPPLLNTGGLPLSQATTVSGTANPVAAQVPTVTSTRGRKRTIQQWDPDQIDAADVAVSEVVFLGENSVAPPPARRNKHPRVEAAETWGRELQRMSVNKPAPRTAGADDVRLAVADAQRLFKDEAGSKGFAFISNLFSTAPGKAVGFLALEEKESKWEFLLINGIQAAAAAAALT